MVDVRILVTGGTGQLGGAVVARLRAAGEEVRVLSRRAAPDVVRGDLRTGRGIDSAVAGVDAVVHCATDYLGREAELARTLVEAARWAGGPHLVYVSIVGVDRVPLGYYRAKHEAEQVIASSGLPYTIQRATQFHALVRTLFAGASRLPVLPVPRLLFQPVDVRDVAARLADLAPADPAGRAPDFGGPEVLAAAELAQAVAEAGGRRRRIVPVSVPGETFRAYTAGGHLAPEHREGKITFAEYLAEQADAGALGYRRR
ncbi:NmrA family transcriptional regulator [Amycolatopsis balhimycina DSM 5908]|uniref:NmrA family transcriptional regulator n=1 Tax=Amycolatopsis balhimycina DSM 5908 TaxID=1081091 RepID=A0A428WN53_AMYBA|nr:NAD(P)H-binding protein [Amycolatopsis balhimycina]RSM44450.1 NmrA family transcriptional regulator [Amycolatopsis balhimycina DSM 5908]